MNIIKLAQLSVSSMRSRMSQYPDLKEADDSGFSKPGAYHTNQHFVYNVKEDLSTQLAFFCQNHGKMTICSSRSFSKEVAKI